MTHRRQEGHHMPRYRRDGRSTRYGHCWDFPSGRRVSVEYVPGRPREIHITSPRDGGGRVDHEGYPVTYHSEEELAEILRAVHALEDKMGKQAVEEALRILRSARSKWEAAETAILNAGESGEIEDTFLDEAKKAVSELFEVLNLAPPKIPKRVSKGIAEALVRPPAPTRAKPKKARKDADGDEDFMDELENDITDDFLSGDDEAFVTEEEEATPASPAAAGTVPEPAPAPAAEATAKPAPAPAPAKEEKPSEDWSKIFSSP